MDSKHTPGPFAVGDYATAEQIDAAIRAHHWTNGLGRAYSAHERRCTLLSGEDAQWAIDTHCKGYAFPLSKAEDFTAVLLYGNEDAPVQVWGTTTSEAPMLHHEFERLA